jgi:hypothetical protein
MRFAPRFIGLLVLLAAPFARADQRLTFVMRLTNGPYPSNLVPKGDPKLEAEFKKDMQEQPVTALMMGLPVTLTMWIGNGKERLDMGPASFIITHNPEKTIGLDRKAKTFQTMPPDPDQAFNKLPPVQIKDTGRTRTIAGHVTHEFAIETRGTDDRPLKMRMWTAPDLPSIPISANPLFRQMSPSQRRAFSQLKGAVLRFEMEMPAEGKKTQTFSEQIVAISDAPISDSTFEVPADYGKASKG